MLLSGLHFSLIALLQIGAEPVVIHKPLPRSSTKIRDTANTNFIVLHYDDGDGYAIARRTLIKRHLAYHYYIERSGRIIKMVDPKYEIAHAGPSLWRSYLRMNKYSIGICLQNNPPQQYTDVQYVSLAWLIKVIQNRFKDKDSTAYTILGHGDIATPRGRKMDPGEHFDWGKLYSILGYDNGYVRRN